MTQPISRRTVLKALAAQGVLAAAQPVRAGQEVLPLPQPYLPGYVTGKLTGAQAIVETLIQEGTDCVFGIPGAQQNELWDAMKQRGLCYLLVTNEFSASMMADGAARSTGKPGVVCLIPGPGVTNALTGIGEALLDSVPMVCIVGDVARGEKYHPFQVHDLPQVGLLQQVTKGVFEVHHVSEIPGAIRQAFQLACCGEPGPAAVVVPYNLLIDKHDFHSGPLGPCPLPWDECAFEQALIRFRDRKVKIGIYAGLGCMDYPHELAEVAELLQAPVATSVSGKGVISDCHPLAVGWGYGPQGTRTAERIFKDVDLVLAIGVKYSEVSTAYYNIPKKRVIQVDINPCNLGKIVPVEVCVNADAGLFMRHLLENADCVRRPPQPKLIADIHSSRQADFRRHREIHARCGVDPMSFILMLRCLTCKDALVFVDVTVSEHLSAEAFQVYCPRTYFNPTDNQAMGWSIPAALGAQKVNPCKQVVTITGDGCMLMSGMELSTAARECLPVKFFILDDQTYYYMQILQRAAYLRTTATVLAKLDYGALAQGFGLAYNEIKGMHDLEAGIRRALCQPGPVLTRVQVDYDKTRIRWINAARQRFVRELSAEQKIRFMSRLGVRALRCHREND
ncbi:MAG: thiamine pyrophosphate-binding protein [Gemmataceae bacterium]